MLFFDNPEDTCCQGYSSTKAVYALRVGAKLESHLTDPTDIHTSGLEKANFHDAHILQIHGHYLLSQRAAVPLDWWLVRRLRSILPNVPLVGRSHGAECGNIIELLIGLVLMVMNFYWFIIFLLRLDWRRYFFFKIEHKCCAGCVIPSAVMNAISPPPSGYITWGLLYFVLHNKKTASSNSTTTRS